MLDKIVDGISVQLNSAFGDEFKIYTEQIKQGLKPPCFFIQLVNPMNIKLVGGRYIRQNLFDIHYFPASAEPNAECYNVQDVLYLAMEYITADGDLIRGINMRGEFVDGVLHFFVNYNMVIRKIEELTFMELMQLNLNTKG